MNALGRRNLFNPGERKVSLPGMRPRLDTVLAEQPQIVAERLKS
jgi:hypothetical protein